MDRPLRKQGGAPPRLFPQVLWLVRRFCGLHSSRGSELAREDFLSSKAGVLNVPPPSQASLLPQVLWMPSNLWLTQIRGTTGVALHLAREDFLSSKVDVLNVPASSQARWSATPVAPTGSVAGPQVLWLTQLPWERACSRRLSFWQSRCAECTAPFASKLAPTSPVPKHPLKTPDLSVLQLVLN